MLTLYSNVVFLDYVFIVKVQGKILLLTFEFLWFLCLVFRVTGKNHTPSCTIPDINFVSRL